MPKQTNDRTTGLSTDDFLKDPRIAACLDKLAACFPPGENGKPFIISDVIDDQGHQYVNLVQKGGGVLGIALVGYTYILEQMNIRFIRLAGTSAGAINTALMTVIGKKEEAKSTQVLDSICKLDFFKLVDGHPVARWVIKRFITQQDFTTRFRRWVLGVLLTLIFLSAGDLVLFGLQHSFLQLAIVTKLFFILTGVFLLGLCVSLSYMVTLLGRLKNAGFGINPGDYLYDWIKIQLLANNIRTVSDLNNKASAPIPGIRLRVPNEEGLNGLQGDVTFIASELVTQNKIQFPAMCNLFRKPADIDNLQPAGFVRASMSIPIFFESYFINGIPCDDPEVKEAWLRLNEDNPPSSARFVDGGILSNFPINLFYNPSVITPRLPSFGIDLDDSKPDDAGNNSEKWSPAGYFGRMFNTIRNYYDKDFLIKNKIFELGIGTIPLADFNWLNFFITDKDKIDMFVRGAETATGFLIKFDWNEYKDNRNDKRQQLMQVQTPIAAIRSIAVNGAGKAAAGPTVDPSRNPVSSSPNIPS